MTLETRGTLTYYAFPPAALGIYATPTAAGYLPHRSDAPIADGFHAALNGPMFALCAGQSARVAAAHPGCTGNCQYAYADCERLDYAHLDASAGIADPGRNPGDGLVIAVVDGVATVATEIPPNASVGVQLYPALVRDGVVQPTSTGGSNGEVVWRSALAILADGSLAFVVGRATMAGFARAIADLGAVAAGYTDGGGSTALATDAGERVGSAEDRPVPSWLVAGDPGSGATGNGLLAFGAAALAAASAWWLLRRRA